MLLDNKPWLLVVVVSLAHAIPTVLEERQVPTIFKYVRMYTAQV
jgi:hypothetical protein